MKVCSDYICCDKFLINFYITFLNVFLTQCFMEDHLSAFKYIVLIAIKIKIKSNEASTIQQMRRKDFSINEYLL